MKNLKNFLTFAACSAVLCSIGCGGGSHSSTTNTIASSGTNVAPITVNAGPAGNYVNGAFASVTVCVPGTSTCQTIDGLLVDTGSIGLRILSTALTIALPQEKASDGNPIAECVQFVDSYTWGPVKTADMQIASETASGLPIQVLSDTDFTVPSSSCTSSGTSADTLPALEANGILGVGLFPQDCGSPCPATQNMYYECPSSTGCVAIVASLTQQVQNPVVAFASDNNGVILELPAVSGAEATLSGSLVFGIGTQSNNGLGSATVYNTDPNGDFTTVYKNNTYSQSFIDSGSNGYFLPDSSIPQCAQNSGASGFYCPTSTENLSATNQGNTVGSGTVDFSVANAVTLFSNASDSVFGDLGGPASGYFDWGLPFFYGRNVYTAIEGTSAPGGTPPYWAY
ncbi:MAG: DUF3443 domain-containing protein [Candidatus Sulfotelmatobacter sp.]